MKVDDYGCFLADTRLLKSNLYPLLLDSIREADISRWMTECENTKDAKGLKSGLLVIYEVDSKRYLQIQDFRQRLRQMRSKYPLPVDGQLTVSCQPEVETNLETETETEKPLRAVECPFTFGTPVFNAWSEWEEYRKEKKQKLTPSTIKKQIQFLGGRTDTEIIEILDQSITAGWTGLFELKRKNNDRKSNKRSSDAIVPAGDDFGTFD